MKLLLLGFALAVTPALFWGLNNGATVAGVLLFAATSIHLLRERKPQ